MIMRHYFLIFAIAAPLITLLISALWAPFICLFIVLIPVIALGLIDMFQTRHTIRRNYPFLGRFRYMLEAVRPEIQQYFVESDTSGTPIPREFRSLVYQRSKGDRDTRPFGTIFDVNRAGYEWVNHSLTPKHATDVILVGAAQTEPIQQGLEAAGFSQENVLVVEEVREAMAWYEGNLQTGDTVMFLNDLLDKML